MLDRRKKRKNAQPLKQTRGFFMKRCVQMKGFMNAELAVLPYSRKALEILAETLKIHRSMVWLDPVTNRISIKQFDLSDKDLDAKL